MLYQEMIAVCSERQKAHKCTTWADLSITEFNPAGIYRDDWALRRLKNKDRKICRPKSVVLIINILGSLQHVSVQKDQLQAYIYIYI